MDTQERHLLVSTLESKMRIVKEEIKLKELELSKLSNEIFDARMIKFTWNELKEWLLKNRPENDYKNNPIVSNDTHVTYCYIDKDGELCIGAFGGDDRFPRGCDLYVPYNFTSWRS